MSTQIHLALLGDSTLDNARYVPVGQAVVQHLRRVAPAENVICMLATDGDTTQGVFAQIKRLPMEATHLVLSVGGNDALGCLPTLDRPVRSLLEALNHLQDLQTGFRCQYDELLGLIKAQNKPTLVCTIYDSVPGLTPALKAALSLFNDVITRAALRHHFEVLDLRELLTQKEDFSPLSPIEPSGTGGAKVSAAIARWAGIHPS